MCQQVGFHPGEEEKLQFPVSFLFQLTLYLLRGNLLKIKVTF